MTSCLVRTLYIQCPEPSRFIRSSYWRLPARSLIAAAMRAAARQHPLGHPAITTGPAGARAPTTVSAVQLTTPCATVIRAGTMRLLSGAEPPSREPAQ
jgi:hypothetical protein